MHAILILFHNPSNSGFASSRHENTFATMAYNLTGDYSKVHFAYTDLSAGRPANLRTEVTNVISFDSKSTEKASLRFISDYIRDNHIDVVFGFDQSVTSPSYKTMRLAGVKWLISYMGAPMSSMNRGIKLLLKKIDYRLRLWGPDHYIFQSTGMQATATHGRGIPFERTSVVKSGTDVDLFSPAQESEFYAHEHFGISRDKKIVFFSGNMEPRKGVDVIVRTAMELINVRNRLDMHFLLVGNRWNQRDIYHEMYVNSPAEAYISFGGYRNDVPQLMRSCSIGMIASTGWDSYPMSAVEMAATGLPLVVSDLPGLNEVVAPDTGMLFPVGDYGAAASALEYLMDNEEIRCRMSTAARKKVMREQTTQHQIKGLEEVIHRVIAS